MLESVIVPAALLLAFALMLVSPLLETLLARIQRTEFYCAVVGRDVEVVLTEPSSFGISGPLDVRSCSAFAGRPVSCSKSCLQSCPWKS